MKAVVVGLTVIFVVFGIVRAAPPDHDSPGITVREYQRRVELALRPVFLPIVTQWVEERYGPEARARIRFIGVEQNGTIHVHIDAEAPGKSCIFALFYKWDNGWKPVQIDNHSPSASGCS